jgi:hypothetical protein
MEYFLGSVITMVAMFVATKLISSEKKVTRENPFRYSQSHIHEIISPLIPHLREYKKIIPSQSRNQEEKTNIKVVIFDNKAYFVRDAKFYCAEMHGTEIDGANATLVDTMGMDKVQLDKMLFIMDQLRDGKKNDSGDSGDQ